jgi:hypothetical protein
LLDPFLNWIILGAARLALSFENNLTDDRTVLHLDKPFEEI